MRDIPTTYELERNVVPPKSLVRLSRSEDQKSPQGLRRLRFSFFCIHLSKNPAERPPSGGRRPALTTLENRGAASLAATDARFWRTGHTFRRLHRTHAGLYGALPPPVNGQAAPALQLFSEFSPPAKAGRNRGSRISSPAPDEHLHRFDSEAVGSIRERRTAPLNRPGFVGGSNS